MRNQENVSRRRANINRRTAEPDLTEATNLARTIVTDTPGLQRYHALGKAIVNACGDGRIKRVWLAAIETQSKLAKSSLTKSVKFAKKYTDEQLTTLTTASSGFIPSWRDIANNLTLETAAVLTAFSAAGNDQELRNALRLLKQERAAANPRRRTTPASAAQPVQLQNAGLEERLAALEAEYMRITDAIGQIKSIISEQVDDDDLRENLIAAIEDVNRTDASSLVELESIQTDIDNLPEPLDEDEFYEMGDNPAMVW